MAAGYLFTDPQLAGAWTLRPDRSSLRFTARTLWGLIPVHGRFTEFTGEGHIGADGAVSGRLVIRADSISTGVGMRDKHLRSDDFFATDSYPDIVVEVVGPDLAATLSIRGTTLPVGLASAASRQDDGTVAVTASGRIDRTEWGISGNMLGMMPPETTLTVEAIFAQS